MSVELNFIREGICLQVREGTTLLQAQQLAGLVPDAPCGGKGTCGKCLADIRFPGDPLWQRVKACATPVTQDLQVRTLGGDKLAVLETDQIPPVQVWDPWVAQTDDEPVYMAAFDLGTTSLAGFLVSRAGTVARAGMRNPQTQYGADVISRVQYALGGGTQALTECVRSALNKLLGQLCAQAGIHTHQIRAVSLVGNTCMHHLFLGICPESLATIPYSPTVTEPMVLRCGDYGLETHPEAQLLMLPVIAGFVGADTVGCMLACDWEHREELTLLIDIGTNGEIVLGNRHRSIACSTAAGPAFEGALISCGMRGAPGAIDHVTLKDGQLVWSVIGGEAPVGICGSGLIDLTWVLLQTGKMDESGRLEAKSYTLPGTDVTLTQKDIRQVQLAKAAITAGIQLLARQYGVTLEDIDTVCIAGAFGTFMDPDSACGIGLIPQELRSKIHPIGNAAGAGARLPLQDRSAWERACRIARDTEFLELATFRDFQDTYVDALEFPEI